MGILVSQAAVKSGVKSDVISGLHASLAYTHLTSSYINAGRMYVDDECVSKTPLQLIQLSGKRNVAHDLLHDLIECPFT